ncbi:hypothetical protein FB451DRAFT_1481264 [Mycena latifolia]|nr:hypothetical protein FB451DRAFT_1481264 [Mycena latifolia]
MVGRLRFPSRSKLKLPSAVSRPQPKLLHTVSKLKPHEDNPLPDALWTCLLALKESSDAFPPLKSAVGGVIAICDIAERAKHSKDEARDIAVRANEILNVVADAVPDVTAISPLMRESSKRFATSISLIRLYNLIDKIRRRLKSIALASGVSRVLHLNSNERTLQIIKTELDDAYHDLVASFPCGIIAASTLRVEVQSIKIGVQQGKLVALQTQISTQQMHLSEQQANTHRDVGKVVAATDSLAPDLSMVLVYSRMSFFLASP